MRTVLPDVARRAAFADEGAPVGEAALGVGSVKALRMALAQVRYRLPRVTDCTGWGRMYICYFFGEQ